MPAILDDERRGSATPPGRRPGRRPQRSGQTKATPIGRIPVDRSSPVPLYYQIAQYLEAAIDSGAIPPGTRLDNELQLAAELGLSRPTVRRAIQYLVEKGLVVRKRGIGTKVVHTRVKRAIELTSLYDDLSRTGQVPTTTVLANRTEPAPAAVASALNVAEGTAVIALDRLRYAQAEPIARLRNYLPTTMRELTTDALQETGLYQLFRAHGIQLHAAIQTIGARTADAAEARLLGEPKGAPLLTMERVTYDDHGSVVEYGTHIYRASRYCFEQSLMAH
jgi:GntR family transcriptional regulator